MAERKDLHPGVFVKGISRRGIVMDAHEEHKWGFIPVHWCIEDEWEYSNTNPDYLTVIPITEFSDAELDRLIPGGIWIDRVLYTKEQVQQAIRNAK